MSRDKNLNKGKKPISDDTLYGCILQSNGDAEKETALERAARKTKERIHALKRKCPFCDAEMQNDSFVVEGGSNAVKSVYVRVCFFCPACMYAESGDNVVYVEGGNAGK